MSRFSRRLPAHRTLNRLAHLRARLERTGRAIVDLTESNPTRAGFAYPAGLLDPLASPRGLRYEPAALGLPEARAAVARALSRRGLTVDPARVILTASTSDAYGMLFKLLCDPGQEVLVPRPSYPLLDFLADLDGVRPVPYPLELHGQWAVDVEALRRAAGDRARAVLMVNPNNPTGSFVAGADLEAVRAVCRERRLALVVDEVFGWFPLGAAPRGPSVLETPSDVLTFVLGGLSKAVGLPQLKLGWIVATGPDELVDAALDRVELIADTYLGVSTPVQLAAEHLLTAGQSVTAQIADRVRANYQTLASVGAAFPAVTRLPVEGGWYAVLQVPGLRSEEALVLELLGHEGVLVHPGYFFDFPREAFLVVSLLPRPATFEPAVRRVLARSVGTPSDA